jgi:nicotinamidase-related amidase
MFDRRNLWRGAVAAAGVVVVFLVMGAMSASALAGDIISDWSTVKAPPVPELKAVTVDPSTTALLILDMSKSGSCAMRPRCGDTIPNVTRLYEAARAAGAMLWYSLPGAEATAADVYPGFQPRDGEYEHQGGPDKFLGSHLDEKLKARGIQTVIVCGTSFQGVGIGVGTEAAQRGYKVIVPVDCLSSEDAYMEQYSAWHLYKGGPAAVTRNSTLTRSTMVKFGGGK